MVLTHVLLVYTFIILTNDILSEVLISKMKEAESIEDSRSATKYIPGSGVYYKTTEYLVKWKDCSELVV